MISLHAVRKTRGQGAQRYSLHIDRLQLAAGARVALVGPSGCGKSTLLDLLALVLAPDAAEGFVFAGTDVAGLWRQRRLDQLAALRSRQLGYVLQAALNARVPPLMPGVVFWALSAGFYPAIAALLTRLHKAMQRAEDLA